ncbi:MAG: DsrE/DsrF/DrsH-like family protein [Hyphomicrobiales bacterium]|nr:DsrE/DsrF/DrsH-like family protein [Hyphomicrobiales bacterium]MCP5370142.1 DsrE/DsrF/DrsH-like family protein [Hyphomicrobiales bacterium]
MAADPAPGGGPPDKLSIVVFSGEFDKVHYALVLASGAAAIGRPVTLFFTMEACRAILRPGADGAAAWRARPTTTGGTGGAMDDGFAARRVATFEELLEACVAMGVAFMVCEMGLRAMDLPRDALRDDIPFQDGGVVTFLNDASRDGAMLFV